MSSLVGQLRAMDVCDEALEWVEAQPERSAYDLWRRCDRGDWLLWLGVHTGAWGGRAARLYAADCAEHVLPIFEAAYPGGLRPWRAIEVARRYARGEASVAELDAAHDAALDAALATMGAASRSTMGAATRSAAGASARAAARSASRAATSAAVWAASWAATSAASWAAERCWQARRLRRYARWADVRDALREVQS